MKKTEHRHLPKLEVFCPKEYSDPKALEKLSKRVFYRGSEDHKGMNNCFGFPLTPPRKDASVCDNGITQPMAQQWLRDAVKRGNIQWTVEKEKHPRYVFGKIDGRFYLARLLNDGKGEYKGYPIQEDITVIKGFNE